jgi:hypothetical protein
MTVHPTKWPNYHEGDFVIRNCLRLLSFFSLTRARARVRLKKSK